KTGQIVIRPAASAGAAHPAGSPPSSSSNAPFAPRITVVKVTTGTNIQSIIHSTTQTFHKTAKAQIRTAAGAQQPQQLLGQRIVGQQRVGTTVPYQVRLAEHYQNINSINALLPGDDESGDESARR